MQPFKFLFEHLIDSDSRFQFQYQEKSKCINPPISGFTS